MMKILFLFPPNYSLSQSFEEALSQNGEICIHLNYRDIIHQWEKNINTQIFRLTDNVRQFWERYFFEKINKWYKLKFDEIKPDILFVYNNEMLHPETLNWLKKKKIKIVFYIGDSPFFTPTNRYNLTLVDIADSVFVPDTSWELQLKKIGIKNVHYILPPLPKKTYFPLNDEEIKEYNIDIADIVYTGMSYKNAWGYKKQKFLSMFSELDLKIYGDSTWNKWLPYFPELKDKIVLRKSFIPVNKLNAIYNTAKILPVDGNPGIQHGIHSRITEAISAGVLPLAEWNQDMEFVFEGVTNPPFIKDYNEIPKMASHYLSNDDFRSDTVLNLKKAYEKKFNPESVARAFAKSLT